MEEGGAWSLQRQGQDSQPPGLTSARCRLGLADEGEAPGAPASAQERAHRGPLPEAPAGGAQAAVSSARRLDVPVRVRAQTLRPTQLQTQDWEGGASCSDLVPLSLGMGVSIGTLGLEPLEPKSATEPPPYTPPGPGEWTASQSPEVTCGDPACPPKQCPSPGVPPRNSRCWVLGGGPLARSTPPGPGHQPALRTATSSSRLVHHALRHMGSCPRKLSGSRAPPGCSPGTHLEAGDRSSWRGRREEWE